MQVFVGFADVLSCLLLSTLSSVLTFPKAYLHFADSISTGLYDTKVYYFFLAELRHFHLFIYACLNSNDIFGHGYHFSKCTTMCDMTGFSLCWVKYASFKACLLKLLPVFDIYQVTKFKLNARKRKQ